ncbi:peptide-methionine (S)-S-oxide reductase MsrA [Marinicellulosiphila megalodicopiae]|uniref:peptide-methionine (S)-S-oxide reductase MsrA n=1 Tax=Marinicellulosiphila megalodicopiae TaxID=2724896 RepID=UPI003BAF0A8B
MNLFFDKTKMIEPENALKDNAAHTYHLCQHDIFKTALNYQSEQHEVIYFAMGCYWGAERLFWQTKGVSNTAVGFAGGITAYPTYEQTCTGKTGHTETVKVTFNPQIVSVNELLTIFWENHDPSQGMRQGNDIGTVYRSAIFCNNQQLKLALASQQSFAKKLKDIGHAQITTEIETDFIFYFAQPEHQQYLAKLPDGYCALRGIFK